MSLLAFAPGAALPLGGGISRAALSTPSTLSKRALRMCSSSGGPRAPADFTAPKPRLAYVRGDALPRIAGGVLALALRGGTGATVVGYRVGIKDGKLSERSVSLPAARPREPLVLYAFPACPFCRKVFEALSMLDLDVLVKPCPKGGKVYRPFVEETFGKAQFPYLYDPNSGFSGYESSDIIDFLFKTYGGLNARPPLALRGLGTATAGLASLASGGRGGKRVESVVTAPKPLVVWGYEPSPFCKVVFERLHELEIPYVWRTTARGSPTRDMLNELTGRIQVPYLEDENTGVSMFESADIVDYLNKVYGTSAPGSKSEPTAEERAAANSIGVVGTVETAASVVSGEGGPELDPKPSTGGDPLLEEYCDVNPDADECRTYDD